MNAETGIASRLPLHALNPFMPGAGKQPPELVGRTHDLEIMDRMIARTKLGLLDRGVIYSGCAVWARPYCCSNSTIWPPSKA